MENNTPQPWTLEDNLEYLKRAVNALWEQLIARLARVQAILSQLGRALSAWAVTMVIRLKAARRKLKPLNLTLPKPQAQARPCSTRRALAYARKH